MERRFNWNLIYLWALVFYFLHISYKSYCLKTELWIVLWCRSANTTV